MDPIGNYLGALGTIVSFACICSAIMFVVACTQILYEWIKEKITE